eukprot:Sspe_Gene.113596::Locus_98296_Transcript_1_1_Confidence_1.000_Length_370::g.113596::m.113596
MGCSQRRGSNVVADAEPPPPTSTAEIPRVRHRENRPTPPYLHAELAAYAPSEALQSQIRRHATGSRSRCAVVDPLTSHRTKSGELVAWDSWRGVVADAHRALYCTPVL